jgi:ATP-binding cassette subfamily F protein 3
VERGNRIAFVGKNGEGKSTMVKILMQELDYEGDQKLGYNVKIGYFAQNQADLMDPDLTALETIDKIAVGDIRTKIRDILGAFMFSGDDVEKKVKVLSGGERTRLAMIKLLLEPVNFLVLDEPTNHLDIHSKELLKQALMDFDGTLLIVSHDREFMDGLVDVVYEFKDKKLRQHLGGIYDFLQKKKIESFRELEVAKSPKAAEPSTPKEAVTPKKEASNNGKPPVSFEERKDINRMISRLEKQVTETENKITEIESKIASLDLILSDSKVDNFNAHLQEYTNTKKDFDKWMKKWEDLQLELEEWTNKKTW